MKHILPLGTKVSFEGEPYVFIVADYTTLLGPCPSDCPHDHDCYEEAYITVKQETGRAFPLSKLRHVFDQPNNAGRVATPEEKRGVE